MAETYIYALLALLLVAAGLAGGVLLMISLGIKRDGGFPAKTDDRAARAARRVIGVGIHRAEPADESSRQQDIVRA